MNNITIAGKVGQPPELRYTTNNMAILTFGVGTTSGKDDKRKTTWHNITVFGQLAENAANSLQKGTNVIIVGRYDMEEYETKQGEKRKAYKIIADEVGLSVRWAPATSHDGDKFDNQVAKIAATIGADDDF